MGQTDHARRPRLGRVPTGSFAFDERLVGFQTTVGPIKSWIGTGWWLVAVPRRLVSRQ